MNLPSPSNTISESVTRYLVLAVGLALSFCSPKPVFAAEKKPAAATTKMSSSNKERSKLIQSLSDAQKNCRWDEALGIVDRLRAMGGTEEQTEMWETERHAIEARMAFESTPDGQRWRSYCLKLAEAATAAENALHFDAVDAAQAASAMQPGEWAPYEIMIASFVRLGRWDEALKTIEAASVTVENPQIVAQMEPLKKRMAEERAFAIAMQDALRCVKDKNYKEAASFFERAWRDTPAKRLDAANGALACHLVLDASTSAREFVTEVERAGKAVSGTDAAWGQWKKLKASLTPATSPTTAKKGTTSKSGGSKSATKKKSMADQFLNGL